MSRVLPPTDDALDRAARVLREGGRVGLPTETVYGLAAHGLDPEAVAGIYAAKHRPSFNPLILHVTPRDLASLHADGITDADRLSPEARALVDRLLAAAWPGPLTVVLPRGPAVPDLTTAGLDTVGVRAPAHTVAQALLARVGVPLAAPSANRSGRISPTTAADVADELGEAVALVLDGGPCEVGVESTVLHVSEDGVLTVLRPGHWTADALVDLTGQPVRRSTGHAEQPRSPGMTARHYAPDTPLLRLPATLDHLDEDAVLARLDGRRAAVLVWDAAAARRVSASDWPLEPVFIDADGDLTATARGLYRTLRALDRSGAEVLLAEPFPPDALGDDGLAYALRDRIRRASTAW